MFLPMIRTFGCPDVHESSGAIGSFPIPKFAAADREVMLTTAWARLSRLDTGCCGIVYRSS
jgi:hypothetical protein